MYRKCFSCQAYIFSPFRFRTLSSSICIEGFKLFVKYTEMVKTYTIGSDTNYHNYDNKSFMKGSVIKWTFCQKWLMSMVNPVLQECNINLKICNNMETKTSLKDHLFLKTTFSRTNFLALLYISTTLYYVITIGINDVLW